MSGSATQPERTAPYIFVSYASADRDRVLPVVDALERAGIAVWIDRDGIHGGANYGREIAEAIKGAAALVLMASGMSLASRNVKQEIAVAWEYERPYLPLLLEPVAIPDDVKYWLTAAQWIEVLDKPEGEWLPPVLAALAPLGIVPVVPQHEAVNLAGREKELGVLREKLANAKGGKGGLVLIGGEAGVGKTTLAEASLREAASLGFAVLEGHCFDLAETPPYGPWIDLFARYEPPASSPPLPAAFAQRGTVGAVASQMALFVQVQDFLKAVASRKPIALLLDDLHWSDPASLDLLRFLARSVATLPLLILVTYRSDELTRRHPLYQLLPLLVREAGAARLDLRRLDDDAVRSLVTKRYGLPEAETARLATYLQDRAEGNALFLSELLRSLEEGGVLREEGGAWALDELTQVSVPTLLRQVIDTRLARLDDESQRLLTVAAVIGHEVPLSELGPLTDMDDEALLTTVERAVEAHLLVETLDGLQIRFVHALIREAVYESISPARRRLLHRRIGELLAAQSRPDPDAVAMHFQRSADERAVAWLVKAGERAQLAYAWLTAAERYEAALELLEASGDDFAQQGWLRYRIGRLRRMQAPQQGVEYLDAALRIAAAADDRALAAAARYTRGLCLAYAGVYEEALPVMAAGCDALEALPTAMQERLDCGPDESGVPVITSPRGMLVWQLAVTGRIEAAIEMGEATREGTPRRTPLGELAWAHYGDRYAGLGIAYALAGRPDAAREVFERGREILRATGHHSTLSGVTSIELLFVAHPYRTDRADERLRLAEEGAEARGRAGHTGSRSQGLATIPLLTLTGKWARARAEAEAIMRAVTMEAWRIFVPPMLGELARVQGEPDAAWAQVRRQLSSGAQTTAGGGSHVSDLTLIRLAAGLSLDANSPAAAKEWMEAHDRWLAWSGAVLGQSEGQTLWAQYYQQAGDLDTAYKHAERALAHATEPRQPLALLAAHRLIGALDTDAGRFDDAATHLEASLALADACQAPYERALSLLATAELRAATGDTDDTKRLLEEVRGICEPLGAKPTLARVAALAGRLAEQAGS